MNVERLHRVLKDLREDITDSDIIEYSSQIETNLENQVKQPNQPSHQTKLVESLKEMYSALEDSTFNVLTPSTKQIIAEVTDKLPLGNDLKIKFEEIFATNSITPANALEEIKAINSEMTEKITAIDNTLEGFEGLNIPDEDLKPGESELGYSIPRAYVDNKLVSLKDEIAELNFILNAISEAVTGEKQDYEVRTISSSAFLLYIIIGLQVADAISRGIERILNHYEQVLRIRTLRNQLKEEGIPESKTKSIGTHANGLISSVIKEISKEIMDEYYKGDDGRKNELENALTISFNKLANRIDKGFHVEIRVKQLDQPEEVEEISDEDKETMDLITSIQQSSRNIEFIEAPGESILQLPEEKKKASN